MGLITQTGRASSTLDDVVNVLNALSCISQEERDSNPIQAATHNHFYETLRRLVDQWIDAGKWIDGGMKNSDGRLVMRQAEMREAKDTQADTGEYPVELRVRWASPKYPEPIWQYMILFWSQNRPVITIGLDGRSKILSEPGVGQKPRSQEESLHDRAMHQFQLLLDSPERYLVSRCDECGEYFKRRRAPREGVKVQHGVYCEKHKYMGRVRSTEGTRATRRKHLADMVAAFHLDWEPKKGDKTEWLVYQMQRELRGLGRRKRLTWFRYYENFSKRWLTDNRAAVEEAIEAELKRRRHVKS